MEWGNLFRKPKKPFTNHNFERSEGFNVILDFKIYVTILKPICPRNSG